MVATRTTRGESTPNEIVGHDSSKQRVRSNTSRIIPEKFVCGTSRWCIKVRGAEASGGLGLCREMGRLDGTWVDTLVMEKLL